MDYIQYDCLMKQTKVAGQKWHSEQFIFEHENQQSVQVSSQDFIPLHIQMYMKVITLICPNVYILFTTVIKSVSGRCFGVVAQFLYLEQKQCSFYYICCVSQNIFKTASGDYFFLLCLALTQTHVGLMATCCTICLY